MNNHPVTGHLEIDSITSGWVNPHIRIIVGILGQSLIAIFKLYTTPPPNRKENNGS